MTLNLFPEPAGMAVILEGQTGKPRTLANTRLPTLNGITNLNLKQNEALEANDLEEGETNMNKLEIFQVTNSNQMSEAAC